MFKETIIGWYRWKGEKIPVWESKGSGTTPDLTGVGVSFKCPCGDHYKFIGPNHSVSFNKEGAMTIEPSLGYYADEDRPYNWCHMFIRDGIVELCPDCKCPASFT